MSAGEAQAADAILPVVQSRRWLSRRHFIIVEAKSIVPSVTQVGIGYAMSYVMRMIFNIFFELREVPNPIPNMEREFMILNIIISYEYMADKLIFVLFLFSIFSCGVSASRKHSSNREKGEKYSS
jgi:hypothetical protein